MMRTGAIGSKDPGRVSSSISRVIVLTILRILNWVPIPARNFEGGDDSTMLRANKVNDNINADSRMKRYGMGIITSLILLTCVNLYAQPNLVNAEYNEDIDQLKLSFDQSLDPSLGSGVNVNLSVDNGSVNTISLVNPFTGHFINGSDLHIDLSGAEAGTVEGWGAYPASLEVAIDSNIVTNGGTPNNALGYSQVTLTTGGAFLVTSADYNEGTDELHLYFSESVNDASFNVNKLVQLSTDDGGTFTLGLATPLVVNNDGGMDDFHIVLQLNPSEASTLEGYPNVTTSLEVSVADSIVQNGAFAWAQGVSFNDNIAVQYFSGLMLVWAAYEESSDELFLGFNQPLNDASVDVNVNISLSTDDGSASTVNLATPHNTHTGSTGDDDEMVVQLNGTDAGNLESLQDVTTNLEIEMGFGLVRNNSDADTSQSVNYAANLMVQYNAGGGGPTPVGDWHLNDGGGNAFNDNSTYFNNGQFFGNYQWGAYGTLFDGTSAYGNVPAHTSMDFTGLMGIMAWVNYSSNGNTQAIISKRGSAAPNNNYSLSIIPGSDRISFDFYDGTQNNSYHTDDPVPTGQWHHIALSYDGASDPEIYLDGNPMTGFWNTGGFNNMATNPDPVNIGSFGGGQGDFFNGELARVKLYGGTLSQTDVNDVYNNESGMFGGGGAPNLTNAEYNENNQELYLDFDLTLDNGLGSGQEVRLSGDGFSTFVTLTNPFFSHNFSGNRLTIGLSSGEDSNLSNLSGYPGSLEVSVDGDVVLANSTGNNQVTNHGVNITGNSRPFIVSADYYESSDVLTLYFDVAVLDATFNSNAAISLSTDDGGTFTVNLTTPHVNHTGNSGDDDEYVVVLNPGDAATLEGYANLESMLELSLAGNLIMETTSTDSNQAISFMDDVQVTYHPDLGANPVLMFAEFLENQNELRLGFHLTLDSTVGTGDIVVTADNYVNFVTLSAPFNNTWGIEGAGIGILLATPDADAIKALPGYPDGLSISMDSNLVYASSFGNAPVPNMNATVTTINPPNLNWAEIDEQNSEMRFNFDVQLDGTLGPGNQVDLSTDGFNTLYGLTSPFNSYRFEGTDFVIELSPGDLSSIQGLVNFPENLEMNMDAGIVTAGGLDNNEQTNFGVGLAGPPPGPNPAIVGANWDTQMRYLYIIFDQDVADNTYDGNVIISVSTDNGPGAEVELVRPHTMWTENMEDDNVIVINVTQQDGDAIEALPNVGTQLELRVDADLIMDKNTGSNGNLALSYNDDLHVDYNGGGPGPGPGLYMDYVHYDDQIAELRLHFNQAPIDEFQGQGTLVLTADGFANTFTLNLPFANSFFDNNQFVFQLDPGEVSSIESLPGYPDGLAMNLDSGMFSGAGYFSDPVNDYHVDIGPCCGGDPGPEGLFMDDVNYDDGPGEITLHFPHGLDDQQQGTGVFSVSGDGFTTSMDFNFPATSNYRFEQNRFVFILDSAGRAQFESMAGYPNNLEANLDSGVVTGNGYWNDPSSNFALRIGPCCEGGDPPEGFHLNHVFYEDGRRELHLNFSEGVDDASLNISSTIMLSTDNGGPNTMTIEIPMGFDTGPEVDDSHVILTLSPTDENNLINLPGVGGNLTISIDSGFIANRNNPPDLLEPSLFPDGHHVDFNGTPPHTYMQWTEYNEATQELILGFDRGLDPDLGSGSTISLSSDGFLNSFDLINPFNNYTIDYNQLKITLDGTEHANLTALPNYPIDVRINIDADVVTADGGTGNDPTNDWDVRVLGWGGNPNFDHAGFDEGSPVIKVEFDRLIDAAVPAGVDVIIRDMNQVESFTLTSPFNGGYNVSHNALEITLDSSEHAQFTTLGAYPHDLEIVVPPGLVSSQGDFNQESEIRRLDFHGGPGGDPDGIPLNRAIYNPNTNELKLVFGQPLVDSSTITSGTIALSMDGGGPNTVVAPIPFTFNTGEIANDNVIMISMGPGADSLETLAGFFHGDLIVSIDENLFSDQGNNSNMSISFDGFFHVDVMDDGRPHLQHAELDLQSSEIRFEWDKNIQSFGAGALIRITADNFTNTVGLLAPFEGNVGGQGMHINVDATKLSDIVGLPGYGSEQLLIEIAANFILEETGSGNNFIAAHPMGIYIPAVNLHQAHYNTDNGTLRLEFDKEVNDALTNVNGLVGFAVNADGPTPGEEETPPPGFAEVLVDVPLIEISPDANDRVVLLDLAAQMTAINDLMANGDELQFSLAPNIFRDLETGNLGNRDLRYGDRHITSGSVRPMALGRWGMEEGQGTQVGDESDLNNPGTFAADSWIGNGLPGVILDGFGQHVNIPPVTDYDALAEITLLGWVNLATSGKNHTVISKRDANAGHFNLKVNTRNKLEFEFFNGEWNRYESDPTVPMNEWVMVGVVYENRGFPQFIINSEVTEGQNLAGRGGALAPAPGVPIQIGAYNGGSESLEGNVALVRLYNYAKDQGDFNHIFEDGLRSINGENVGPGGYHINDATYDDFNGLMIFHTSDSTDINSVCHPCQFGLSVDNGVTTNVVIASPFSITSPPGEFQKFTLDISAYKEVINAMPDYANNLAIQLPPDFVTKLGDPQTGTPAVGFEHGEIRVLSTLNELMAVGAEYDRSTKILRMIFNRPVNDGSTIDSLALGLTVDHGDTLAILISPRVEVPSMPNDAEISYDLSGIFGVIESWPGFETNLTMAISPGQFFSHPDAALENLGNNWSLPVSVIDTRAPLAITVNNVATNDNTPQLNGTVNDSLATILINVGGQEIAAVNNRNGTWTLADDELEPLADSTYDIIATATNSDGLQVSDSTFNELTVDASAPAVSVNADTADVSSPEVSGTVSEPGLEVTVVINNQTYLAVSNSLGLWQIDAGVITPLAQGTYDVTASVTDSHGNIGIDNTIGELVVDINDGPVLAQIEPSSFKEDEPFAIALEATDADGNDQLAVSMVSGNQEFLTFENDTLRGEPGNSHVGTYSVTFEVSDGELSSQMTLEFEVVNINDVPVLAELQGLTPDDQQWKEDSVDMFTVVLEDVDVGDAVHIDTAQLPDFIRLVRNQLNGAINLFEFRVAPLQKDTGDHQLEIRFMDKSNAEYLLKITANVEETNDMPIAKIVSQKKAGGAIKVMLDVEDEDGLLSETKFEYAVLRADGTEKMSGNSEEPFLELFPLLDGEYTLQVNAIDKHDFRQDKPTAHEFGIQGIETLRLSQNEWHMFSILKPQLVKAELGTVASVLTWVDDGIKDQQLSHYVTGTALDTLTAGTGYWALLGDTASITVTENEVLNEPITIELKKGDQGFNQIGNPFPYPINVNSTGLTFWRWDPVVSDVVDADGILLPWQAYWVQVEEATSITLMPQPHFAGGLLAKKTIPRIFESIDRFNGRMVLTSGKYSDRSNTFGTESLRRSGMHNLYEPPKMGQHISLFFTGPRAEMGGKQYTTDFRNRINTEEEWFEFGIFRNKTTEKTAQLSLEGLTEMKGSGYFSYLVDGENVMPFGSGEVVTLPISSAEKYYSLVITDDENFVENFTTRFKTMQNYPNPVRSLTNIKFTLPYRFAANGKRLYGNQPVVINMYNMKGQRFPTLFNEKLEPGQHTFQWRRPTSMPNGNYVYTIQSGNFNTSKKMVLMR